MRAPKFGLWIIEQEKRDCNVGIDNLRIIDFATDASLDPNFPKSATTYGEIKRYLVSVNARDVVIEALENAYLSYCRSRQELSKIQRHELWGILENKDFHQLESERLFWDKYMESISLASPETLPPSAQDNPEIISEHGITANDLF